MGKNESHKTGLGRALVKQHNKMVQQTKDKNRFYKKKFLESFTEVSDIDAILEQSEEPQQPNFVPDGAAAPSLVINLWVSVCPSNFSTVWMQKSITEKKQFLWHTF